MNNNIIIYPELAASVLANKEEDVFFIWLLAKKVDESGNGIVPLKKIFEIVNNCLGLKSNYVYTKIEKGIDLLIKALETSKMWLDESGKQPEDGCQQEDKPV